MEVVQKVSYRIQIGISNDKLNTCIALSKKKEYLHCIMQKLKGKGFENEIFKLAQTETISHLA